MRKNVLFTMCFLDFVTVFKESYNCQTSHNLGRNQLPKPLLLPLDSLYSQNTIISWEYVEPWQKNLAYKTHQSEENP